ncbi:MAG: Serine/threonine-protein kinase PknD [bacterium ADurb.Bin236]|nr:MAG: Serine/threonine-protein kinase PknD [bacterium ADurb.Bin236]
MTITVNCVPVANAGLDQFIIQPGILVTLDGTASSDANAGDTLTYAWTQTAGAAVVLSSSTASQPTFTPATCGDYTFQLIVNDSHINSLPDSVTITVNCVPVADAGPDQNISAEGVLVTLDGSGSYDSNGHPITYAWSQISGPAVTLSSLAAVNPAFTPLTGDTYVFQLIVNDGYVNSLPDTVTIRVNAIPIANAGPDQFIIQPGVLVTLDGAASSDADGDALTYAWTQTAGAAVVLSSSTASQPTFTPATCGDYTFRLIVNDGAINSLPDFVTITVNCVPVADAGPDQNINGLGITVNLNGSASYDPDGEPLTYLWTQISGPPHALSGATSSTPVFVTADGGILVFQLVVNDGHIDSPPSIVTVGVNYPPIADAGPDQILIQPGGLVTLDGSGSYDPDGSPITYAWSQLSGPAATLSNLTSVSPTFTPAVCGDYIFQLIVNDGLVNGDPDTVLIDVNCVPIANAGPDMTNASGNPKMTGWLISLDGSASSDADGDTLSYQWTQIAGPATVSLSNPNSAVATFKSNVPGMFTFQLIVSDNLINSAPDTVSVELEAGPNPPHPVFINNDTQGQLDISWVPPTTLTNGMPIISPPLAGFFVLRSETPNGPYTQIDDISNAAITTYSDTDVKPFKQYCYVIQAYTAPYPAPLNAPGVSSNSIEVCSTALPVSYKFSATCGNPFVTGNVVPANTPGYFNRPGGIALDGNGYIYVADTDNNRVQKFTTSCQYNMLWGGIGTTNGKFVKPLGIAYNPANGNIYVADSTNRIQYFTTNGVFIGSFVSRGVKTISIDQSGNIYATTGTGLVELFNSSHESVGLFSQVGVAGVHYDPSLGIVVTNASDHKVNILSSSGSVQSSFSELGSLPGQLNSPFGIAIGDSGYFFVADTKNNRIQIFDSAFDVINIIGSYTGQSGYSNGQINNPMDIDVDSNGSVYVIDQYNNRIQIFDEP